MSAFTDKQLSYNPVLSLPCGDTGPTTIDDISVNDNDATVVGTPTFGEPGIDASTTAILCNGSNYIDFSNNADLIAAISDEITVNFSFKPTDAYNSSTATETIIDMHDGTDGLLIEYGVKINPSPISNVTPHTATTADAFGRDTAMSSNGLVLFVGAPEYDTPRSNWGIVEVWTRADTNSDFTWLMNITNPSSSSYSEQFGYGVATNSDGSRVVVGAPFYRSGIYNIGRIYTFDVNISGVSYAENISRKSPTTTTKTTLFGCDVGMSDDGERIVVGEYLWDSPAAGVGRMQSFYLNGTTWDTLYSSVTMSDAASADYAGFSLDISGDGSTVVVGAVGDDDQGSISGSCYIFTDSGSAWTENQKILQDSGVAGDQFGNNCALNNDGTLLFNIGGSNPTKIWAHSVDTSGASATQLATDTITGSSSGINGIDCNSAGNYIVAGASNLSTNGAVVSYDFIDGSLNITIDSDRKGYAVDIAAEQALWDFAYNAGTVKIYKDAVLVDTLTGFPSTISLPTDGYAKANATYGQINIYPAELDAASILDIYNYINYVAPAGLEAFTVIGYNNLLDDPNVTVVASSTKAGAAVANLNNDATFNYWESDE